ncbi:MAG: hypothetical protein LBI42_00100 [Chitinispirillales bacterium]|jgi:hypothetical protein|nr:hypothetical protein [Chitinispirillales bacterium]
MKRAAVRVAVQEIWDMKNGRWDQESKSRIKKYKFPNKKFSHRYNTLK